MANSQQALGTEVDSNLQLVLSDGRKSLTAINEKRNLLQQDIQRKFRDINQVLTDYWVIQAKSVRDYVGRVEHSVVCEEWRLEFATQEALRAKVASAKQKHLWSQVDRMVQDAKSLEDKFWASWQTSLHHLATPEELKQQQLPSQEATIFVQQAHPSERSKQATIRGSKSRGPTALPRGRVSTRSTKASSPASPSELAKPSGSSSPSSAKLAKKDDISRLPESSTSSKAPTLPLPSTKVRKSTKPAGEEAKERASRTVEAKEFRESAPVARAGPRKKRALRSARARINPNPVIDPTPGQLYQAYYHSPQANERGWYMGTVLPWTSTDWADEMMMDFSMRDMDLEADWPECYEPGYKFETISRDGNAVETKELACIEGWKPGFEDGGPRVMDRKFLFLFFEDRPKRLGCLKIDPTEPMSLIKFDLTGQPVPIDWVDAKDLRAWDVDDGTLVRGMSTAEKYRNKLDHVARLRAQARPAHGSMSSQQQPGLSAAMTGQSPSVNELPPLASGTVEITPQVQAGIGGQETGVMPHSLEGSPTTIETQPSLSRKDQGSNYPSLFSPVQLDVDEAYEELQTYTKRPAANKRPLSSDPDEYDEGLGMDYDLNLKRSASQMCRPQASIVGLPPLKVPRLGDYNMPGSSAGIPGLRSPGGIPTNPERSTFRPDSSATTSPT